MKDLLQRTPIWPYLAALGVIGAVLAALVIRFQSFLYWALGLFVVVLVALFLLRRHRQNKAARELDESIESHGGGDDAASASGGGSAAERQQLKKELLEAIRVLKTTRAGKRAMVSLPWYVVLGPKGSGKTEFIRRSGLEFLFHDGRRDPRSFQGVGATRDFSWWLTQDAVLLDMGGQALESASTASESGWGEFLKTIRRLRPNSPINGVLVVVALEQIANKTEAVLDAMARQVRERIEELESRLDIWFPVYVVFSGCDRVAGFNEFFEGLSAEEQRQGWGATVRLRRARSTPAQRIFDEELDTLLHSLTRLRLERVSRLDDPVACARAFAFPLQFERLRASMRRYVRTLFDLSQESSGTARSARPFLRGLYLAASTQQGATVDQVLQPAVAPLGLDVPPTPGIAVAAPNAWFAQKLLQEVVFRDTRLLGRSSGGQADLQWKQRLAIGLAAAVWLVFAVLAVWASRDNAAELRRSLSTVKVDPNQTISRQLAELSLLSSTLERLAASNQNPSLWRRLGGWSGRSVVERSAVIWAEQLKKSVLVHADAQLKVRLANAAEMAAVEPVGLFHALVAYHLLHRSGEMVPADSSILTRACFAELASRLAVDGQQEANRRLLRGQMRLLTTLIPARKVSLDMGPDDAKLAEAAAQQLAARWPGVQLLEPILEDASADYRSIELSNLMPRLRPFQLLECSAQVSGAFTEEAWTRRIRPEISAYVVALTRTSTLQQAVQSVPGSAEIGPALTHEYWGRYGRTWAGFLENTAPKGAPKDYLSNFMGDDSELDGLLIGVSLHTNSEPASREFQLLSEYVGPIKGERDAGWFDRISKALLQRKSQENTLAGEYRKLLDKTRLQVTSMDPAGTTQLADMKVKFSTLVLQTVPEIDAQVGSKTMKGLLDRIVELKPPPPQAPPPPPPPVWAGVVEVFEQNFNGKYPFSASSEEVTIAQFDEFFAPGRGLSNLIAEHFKYLDASGNPRPGPAPRVSPATLAFMKRCVKVQKAFYPANGATAAVSVRVDSADLVPSGNAYPTHATLQVGRQMGPGSFMRLETGSNDQVLNWPSPDGTGDAVLTLAAKQGSAQVAVPPRRMTGTWGLFRLVAQGAPSRQRESVNVNWKLASTTSPPLSFGVWARIKSTTASTNPFEPGLLAGLTPPGQP